MIHNVWCDPCKCNINAQNSEIFYYFYTKMRRAGCGSHQCWTMSNIAEQNLQIFFTQNLQIFFYIFRTV